MDPFMPTLCDPWISSMLFMPGRAVVGFLILYTVLKYARAPKAFLVSLFSALFLWALNYLFFWIGEIVYWVGAILYVSFGAMLVFVMDAYFSKPGDYSRKILAATLLWLVLLAILPLTNLYVTRVILSYMWS
jgi:hypothetical protein